MRIICFENTIVIMKRIILLFISSLLVGSVMAGSGKVKEIGVVTKGGCNLGFMIGVPPIDYYSSGEPTDPTIPTFSFDANWGLASGFIKTKTFGNNGGVDLGAYWGIDHYKGVWDRGRGMLQNSILIRSAFHFEFVKNLDVFMGIANGVNIFGSTNDHPGWDFDDCKYAGGIYGGVKYYFTDHFGLKIEFGSDWNEKNLTNFAGGFTFKF